MNQEDQKIKYKSKKRKLKGIESYSSKFFKIIGFVLLLYSLYFSFDFFKENIQKILYLLSAPGKGRGLIGIENSWELGYYYKIVISLIPLLLSYAFTYFFRFRNKIVSKYLVNTTFFCVTIYQNFLFYHNLFGMENVVIGHTNYYYSSITLVIPTLLFFVFYKIQDKNIGLILISIYFFSTLLQLQLSGFHPGYIFSAILFYNLLFYFITKKQISFVAFCLNFILTYSYLGLFVYRKLYIWHYTSFLNLFFVISFSFFIFYLLASLSLSTSKNKTLVPIIFNWINTLLYLTISCFVVNTFYGSGYLFLILAVIICHSLISFSISKIKNEKSKSFYNEIIIVLLFPALFSVFFMDYFFTIYFGILSVVLLFYYRYNNNKLILISSLLSLQLLIIHFVYQFLTFYLLALGLYFTPSTSILADGFAGIGMIIIAIFGVKRYLSKVSFISTSWLNKRLYSKFVNVALEFLYLVLIAWISYTFFVIFNMNFAYFHSVISLLCIAFATYLFYFKSKIISNSITFYYLLFAFIAILSIINFFEFPHSSINNIVIPGFFYYHGIIHYLQLLLTTILLYNLGQLIIEHKKSKLLKRVFEASLSLLIILIICNEYDYMYYLININNLTLENFSYLIEMNRLIPYSAILFFSAFILLLIGIYNKNRFLRVFAYIILFFDLIKVFYFEFVILTDQERIVILIILGLSFLFLSKIYSKQKVTRRRISSK